MLPTVAMLGDGLHATGHSGTLPRYPAHPGMIEELKLGTEVRGVYV